MEEETLDIYEAYFRNDNWTYSLNDLSSHNCLFCKNSKYRLTFYYKQDASQTIISYLNHLKTYGCKWKKVKYFINSVRLANFCKETNENWAMEYWFEKDIYILYSI